MGGMGSGGFLQSAMTTAAGVAGGALLYQGISSLFHTGGGYGGGFGGNGMSGGYGVGGGYGMGGETVVNETVYETVNNYGTSVPTPPSQADWGSSDTVQTDSGYQDASYDDSSFDSGSDDSFV
jgi:hypothetical protein